MAFDKAFNDASWKIIPAWVDAAGNGDLAAVQKFLQEGMKVDARDVNGTTALMEAVRNGHTEIVQLLLDKEADVNARNKAGHTALFFAAGYGLTALAKTLLARGADVGAASTCDFVVSRFCGNVEERFFGLTPLMLAAQGGHADTMRLLMENKADIEARDSTGRTALILGAANFYKIKDGNLGVLQSLLAAGAKADVMDRGGRTALRGAAAGGHAGAVAAVLEKADPKAKSGDPFWRSPSAAFPALDDALVSAVAGEAGIKIVRLLVRKGADVNVRNRDDGRSLLFLAAQKGDLKVVRFLLKKGADTSLANKYNVVPCGAARYSGHTEVAQLIEAAAKKTPPAAPQIPPPPTPGI